ncbi:hypothetical protein CY0110_17272 [Crocosphaera chwakensis CCY0110]|uniref:Uncharacterized protein n=1 Tax=Crocosphaera chwakensis CCY0110 TaxID=391612 RepID=A3IID6_9CHRO|nr:hypothetical protein CY0110_17272 [Crocosphaera chwakensis CCY0110]
MSLFCNLFHRLVANIFELFCCCFSSICHELIDFICFFCSISLNNFCAKFLISSV